MGFIIKNTSGLINTRLTDTGRQKLSQGNFNISYFQIGDSEVSYNTLPTSYNQFDTVVLEPAFNAQNSSGAPQSNKENVKYPYYVDGITGNTYGIPFMDSIVSPVYNRAVMRGFFTGNTTADTINWSALTNNFYAINANYVVQMNSLVGTNTIKLISNPNNPEVVREPAIGDIITIYYDGKGMDDCSCTNLPTPTPTPTTSVTPSSTLPLGTTPTPTPSATNQYPCDSPTPTPTPSKTPCLTPTPSRQCPLPPPPDCLVDMSSCYSMLTYRITNICLGEVTLDRPTPDFSNVTNVCYGRVIVYPPNMTTIYDSITPSRHWNDNVINFESVCYTDEFDVKIWNMNIPWSENPAGLISSVSKDYTNFGSVNYLGAKEYFGYASSSGQTDSSKVYYYNSFGDIVTVKPEQQKAIGIIHYTNQTVDFFYGEKFALEPYDPSNPADTTGEARNFKLHIPWLMWHKNSNCCNGQTFWVDPPGFDGLDLFQVQYLQSTKNVDMNSPGIRYYHLWDTNPNLDGFPSRVGKVFPDDKLVIIDDEEILAAMSYKANRNWTLPSPKTSLITPNTCGNDNSSTVGILTGNTEYLYVTYRLSNSNSFTNSLHCNYYSLIQGPNIDCSPITSQNVAVRFGGEFGCLTQPYQPTTTTTTTSQYPCWYNGFTFESVYQGQTIFNSYFEPTSLTRNGEPIFFSELGLQISYNGINWDLFAIREGLIYTGGTNSPIGLWYDIENINTGQTSCDTSKIICGYLCSNDTGLCYNLTLYQVSYSGNALFYSYGFTDNNNGYVSCSGDTWYLSTEATESGPSGIILASLTGLTCNDLPIGNFVSENVGISGLTTTEGPCQSTLSCQCYSITATSDNTIVTYFGCDGLFYSSNTLNTNDVIEICSLNSDVMLITNGDSSYGGYFTVDSGSITGDTNCTGTICSGLTVNNPYYLGTTTTFNPITTTTTTTICPTYCDINQGFMANKFEIICQKVDGTGRPNSSEWKIIDFTSQLSSTMINGYITQEGLTGNTFVITQQEYDDAPTYNLNNYIPLTPVGYTGTSLNFGDEYYFYGSLETDIEATIYEMRYKINLGQAEFQTTSNPTWSSGKPSYVTEIGLYDSNKNLMIISKMQSPVLRQGIQQFLIKFDI